MSIVTLYHRFRRKLKPRGALSKLIAIKLLVAVVIIENLAFGGLQKSKFPRLQKLTDYDLHIGVYKVIVSLEMVLYMWLFSAVSSATAYKRARVARSTFFMALSDVLNLMDICMDMWTAVRVLSQLQFGHKYIQAPSTTGKESTSKDTSPDGIAELPQHADFGHGAPV